MLKLVQDPDDIYFTSLPYLRSAQMRATASILLFSLVILVTETASVIPIVMKYVMSLRKKKSPKCGNTQRQSSCGVPDADSPVRKRRNAARRRINDNCKENEKCNSCPICYVFIFQPGYELQVRYFSLENKYLLPKVNDLPSYSAGSETTQSMLGSLIPDILFIHFIKHQYEKNHVTGNGMHTGNRRLREYE